MVGLVLVSHSHNLAQALMHLVQQVASAPLALAIAGGVGETRQEFGTDALEIMEAIQSVYSPDGVVVLMDLGSAILSAEMAVEFLPAEMKAKVRFCPAPLVEGAIAAAVQIGLGADIDAVCGEAQTALMPKQEQLGGTQVVSNPAARQRDATEEKSDAAHKVVVKVHNQHGLHARPAARFVQLAGKYNAEVRIANMETGKGPVSARSLNALASLGVLSGHLVEISAQGLQAQEALDALRRLVEANFGEEQRLAEPEVPVLAGSPGAMKTTQNLDLNTQSLIQAVPVAEGFSVGPLLRYRAAPPPTPTEQAHDPQEEVSRLKSALAATAQSIKSQRERVRASLGEQQAEIFDAHILILQDPDLQAEAENNIDALNQNAAAAWKNAIDQAAAGYTALTDPYLKQRASDVLDVGNQVLFALAGKATEPIELTEPVILFAEELTPAETTQLDLGKILGLITVTGGPTSHSAILARGLGIPAVSGVPPVFERIPDGMLAALDGGEGQVWVNPGPEVVGQIQKKRSDWLEQRQALLRNSQAPALTRDGRRIEVAANIGSPQDARAAAENGAEAVGLLRTEFLYLTRTSAPDEMEQVDLLRQVAQALGTRPIVARTLDVGGDKELPYISLAPEANPFLGVRAIRLSYQRTDLFLTQLRAILRAGAEAHYRVMFPMVANLDELRWARQMVEQAHKALTDEGLAHLWPIETGIMVEIPAAALLAHVFAPEVDFFSIGTNDLTQYTLAAERGNPALAGLADALHPAVLRLIGEVCTAAHQCGKWVGVCGELAGDPLATAVLAGLGVDELSLSPAGVPRIKAVVRALAMPQAQELARQALAASDAAAVRKMAKIFSEANLAGEG